MHNTSAAASEESFGRFLHSGMPRIFRWVLILHSFPSFQVSRSGGDAIANLRNEIVATGKPFRKRGVHCVVSSEIWVGWKKNAFLVPKDALWSASVGKPFSLRGLEPWRFTPNSFSGRAWEIGRVRKIELPRDGLHSQDSLKIHPLPFYGL